MEPFSWKLVNVLTHFTFPSRTWAVGNNQNCCLSSLPSPSACTRQKCKKAIQETNNRSTQSAFLIPKIQAWNNISPTHLGTVTPCPLPSVLVGWGWSSWAYPIADALWLPDQLHHMHHCEQVISKAGKWQRSWQMALKANDLLHLGKFYCSKIFPWVMGQKKVKLLTASGLLWFEGTVLSCHPHKMWWLLSRLLQTQTLCWRSLKPHSQPQVLL